MFIIKATIERVFTNKVFYYQIRQLHLPPELAAKLESIQTMLIKDRKPIGKFKLTPSPVVTVLITIEAILKDVLKY
jgi:hypothetical protein